jgi:hypothetical protein
MGNPLLPVMIGPCQTMLLLSINVREFPPHVVPRHSPVPPMHYRPHSQCPARPGICRPFRFFADKVRHVHYLSCVS